MNKKYDGKIWRADDKIWDSIYPPNDYNCRCNVIALDEEDFPDYGIPLEKSNKRFLEEQKESLGKFGINPAKNYWDVMKKSGIIKKKKVKEVKNQVEDLIFEQIKTTKELETYVKERNLADTVNLAIFILTMQKSG